jgi:AcrR family transcriptional regulator
MFTLSTSCCIIPIEYLKRVQGDLTVTQSYHHGDLRAELIRKGLRILDQDGYKGFSLRKVAKACNVSQTAPYRHFKDKEELISAISAHALEAFNRSLEEAVKKHADPREGLNEMGMAYIRFFVENPEYMRLIFLSGIERRVRSEINDREDHFQGGHPFATFYEAVKRYREAYPSEDWGQNELILYNWGLVHGIASLIVNEAIPYDDDYIELAEKIMKGGYHLR